MATLLRQFANVAHGRCRTEILTARMVLTLGVTLKLRPIKVHIAQVPDAVALCFVGEVRRLRMSAFSTGSYGSGTHLVAELYYSNEAVAAGAVPLFGPWIWPCPEGGKRPPHGRREADRGTRGRIVERLHYVAGEALKAIDVTPWSLPSSEVSG